MKGVLIFISLIAVLSLVATAHALTMADDCYVYYEFEDTNGTVFADTGPNALNATFYRPLKYAELPGLDVSNVSNSSGGGMGDGSIGLGERTISTLNHQTMVRIPSSTALPGAGDTFAVSFWLNVADWSAAAGPVASYNLNGLNWTIGPSAAAGFVVWSGDADTGAGGIDKRDADVSALAGSTDAHFVVQFSGTAGVTDIWVNGDQTADTGDVAWWGNQYEGFTLGGRVLDKRNYSPVTGDPWLDDFAIINGTLNSTDVNTLMTSGAADISFDSQRLAHYTMNDTTGTQITDSSANANHGTLVSYEPTTMGSDVRTINTALRPGVFGTGIKLADNDERDNAMEYATLSAVDSLPTAGEAFTVCFWIKPDEVVGWGETGVIYNWSNGTPGVDGLGFSIAMENDSGGVIDVRCTDGSFTGSSSYYTVYVNNEDTETKNGLVLDPDQYHHVAVTVDDNGDVTGMYIDGDLYESKRNNGPGVTDSDTGVLGCRYHNSEYQRFLTASLDDFGIVKTQLTEAQIAQVIAQDFGSLFESTLIPGDTNDDDIVNDADAAIVATNWGATGLTGGASVGDFNGDGTVDGKDASIMAANWGDHTTSESTEGVPEPGTLVLLVSILLGVVVMRRR